MSLTVHLALVFTFSSLWPSWYRPAASYQIYFLTVPCFNSGRHLHNIARVWQALLTQLYNVGPFTDGIFRKSAGVRKTREVKEKLEAGTEVEFKDVSACVCAAILKVSRFVCLQWVIKIPPRYCGNFSKTVGNCSTKFYLPITRSYLR